MTGPSAAGGDPAKAGGGEPVRVSLCGDGVGVGVEEEASILGHEAEEEAVGEAEESSVIVGEGKVAARSKAGPKFGVLGVSEKAAAERFDCLPDADAQG